MKFLLRPLAIFRRETGQSPALWAVLALISLLTQIVFRRELAPGEFGTLNTALGLIGLMTVPLLAVPQAFAWYLNRPHPAEQAVRLEALRSASLLVTETVAWIWGGLSLLLTLAVLPLLHLPRAALGLFTLMNVFIALGSIVSGAVCQNRQRRFWTTLLIVTAGARLLIGWGLTSWQPWAEAGLAAGFLTGFITLAPVLRQAETESGSRVKAMRQLPDADFLLYLGATFSVLLGIFLFVNADRLVAQSWFGVASNNNMGFVNWPEFDAYQSAGLLARSLLWGTQPLLLVLFAQRSRLEKTTAASLVWFWAYLGILLLGVTLLIAGKNTWSWFFCGADFEATAKLLPVFALSMVPLGLLQGVGMFALASRRYQECFVLGACGIAFTLLLYLVGRQPLLMPAYMFGGGLVCLMIVLFVGVVRWGRKQP